MTAKGYTPSMQAHADVLLSRSDKWARGVRNSDGLAFVLFVGSQAGPDGQPIIYRTTETGCTCRGFLYRGVCGHQLAVAQEARRAREAVGPKRASYRELMANHLVDAF